MKTFKYIDSLNCEVDNVPYNLDGDLNTVAALLQNDDVFVWSQLEGSIVQSILNDVSIEDLDDAIFEQKSKNLRTTERDKKDLKYQADPIIKYELRRGIHGVTLDSKIIVVQTMTGVKDTVSYERYCMRLGIESKDYSKTLTGLDMPVQRVARVLGYASNSSTIANMSGRYFIANKVAFKPLDSEALPSAVRFAKSAPAVLSGSLKVGNKVYSTGNGGLLSEQTNTRVKSDGNNIILEIDVTSMYPSILLMDGVIVDGMVDADVIRKVLALRAASSGTDAMAYKLVNNSLTGLIGSQHSALRADRTRFNVIKTAQIVMAELIVELNEFTNIFKANTDSITLEFHKDKLKHFGAVCNAWESRFNLSLTVEQYKLVHMDARNNYYCEKLDGTYKRRGKYAKRDLNHDGMSTGTFKQELKNETFGNEQLRKVSQSFRKISSG